MASFVLMPAVRRLSRSLTTLPDGHAWRFSVIVGGVAAAAMTVVGFPFHLLHIEQTDISALPLRCLRVLFVPALAEEMFFRGLLVKDRSETSNPWVSATLATVLFVAWHGIETLFLHHAAPIFLRTDFLVCAAVLGAACAIMRWRSASLWPAVIFHWLVVVTWQTWLGGPGFQALM
jgi:predicted Abi (CAAX) family protease